MGKICELCVSATDWVKDQDEVVQPFYESLHGGDNIK